jgi:hypothetical protein
MLQITIWQTAVIHIRSSYPSLHSPSTALSVRFPTPNPVAFPYSIPIRIPFQLVHSSICDRAFSSSGLASSLHCCSAFNFLLLFSFLFLFCYLRIFSSLCLILFLFVVSHLKKKQLEFCLDKEMYERVLYEK